MKLTHDWVVGFVDGEGCFFVGLQKHAEMTAGYQVLPEFTVVQHERDIQVLHALKKFFGFGVVRINHGDRYAYRVRKLENLETVSEFFLKHSLKTKKNVDFRKFRKVLIKIQRKEHLTKQGLLEIINIAKEMNTAKRDRLLEIQKTLCG